MLILCILFSFFCLVKIVVAMVTEIVKMLQKHMDPEITKKQEGPRALDRSPESWHMKR